jgi:hypothetical protein
MHRVQRHVPQQEIQKTGLSLKAPSWSNNATLVQEIMTKLSEAMSEKHKIVDIIKMVLNETNGFWSW